MCKFSRNAMYSYQLNNCFITDMSRLSSFIEVLQAYIFPILGVSKYFVLDPALRHTDRTNIRFTTMESESEGLDPSKLA